MNGPRKLAVAPPARDASGSARESHIARLRAASPLAPVALQLLETLGAEPLTPSEASTLLERAYLAPGIEGKLRRIAESSDSECPELGVLVARMLESVHAIDRAYDTFVARALLGILEPLITGAHPTRDELAEASLRCVLHAARAELGRAAVRRVVDDHDARFTNRDGEG